MTDDIALRRALAYAGYGWPVFPCLPGEKLPATKHGFKDATTDQERIRAWWARNPTRNIAIATGYPGPDVLDVDQRGEAGSGFAAFNRLHRGGLLTGVSALVRTPSGGLHGYFAGSDQASGRLPRHHLDFKAAGGYVLAPPSQVNGRPYVPIRHGGGAGGCLDWRAVTDLLEPPQPRREPRAEHPAEVSHLAGWVAALKEGNRNAGLYWAARRAIDAGRADALDTLAGAAISAGLPESEAWRTLSSARRGAQPRSVEPQPEGGS
jgi:Bifunctional DNA primase/polymerase, N-terminal